MTAAVVVLSPIFEVDMPAEQHAYRAHFSAHTAVRSVHSLMNTGHTKLIEGDLAGYFDSLPHAELLKSVVRRVSDRHLLHLIKMWLDAPVEEDDGKGGTKRTTPNKDSGRGIIASSRARRRLMIVESGIKFPAASKNSDLYSRPHGLSAVRPPRIFAQTTSPFTHTISDPLSTAVDALLAIYYANRATLRQVNT